VAIAPGSFRPVTVHGSTIRHTVVVRPMGIGRLRIALAGLRVGIRWRIARQARDSRLAGRAAICPAIVQERVSAIAQERVLAIALRALAVAVVVWAVVAGSTVQEREAERIG
jgi:hypothetical protein